MDQMQEIADITLKYLRYINWTNLIYLFTFFVFIIYWVTILAKWHRRSSSFFEFFMRRVLPIPFWVLLFYKCFLFAFPNLDFSSYSEESVSQKVEIVNDSDDDLSFNIYKKIDDSWYPAYNEGIVLESYFEVISADTLELSYKFKKLASDRFYIQMNSRNDSNETVPFGKAFFLSEIPIRIYASELAKSKAQRPEINFNFEAEIVILFFISILGLWYYFFAPVKSKEKFYALIFALPITCYGILMSYFAINTILF
jgi:hypothetical protein